MDDHVPTVCLTCEHPIVSECLTCNLPIHEIEEDDSEYSKLIVLDTTIKDSIWHRLLNFIFR